MNHELRSAFLRTLPFLLVICVTIILVIRRKIKPEELDLIPPLKHLRALLWVFGFILFSVLVEAVLYAFELLEVRSWNHSGAASVILIAGAILFAPIAEELLFRGFILNVLKKRGLKNQLAIVLQAIFFVLLHNFTYENTLTSTIGIFQGFVDAVLYACARQNTRSLYTPMAMHMSGNAIAILEKFIF